MRDTYPTKYKQTHRIQTDATTHMNKAVGRFMSASLPSARISCYHGDGYRGQRKNSISTVLTYQQRLHTSIFIISTTSPSTRRSRSAPFAVQRKRAGSTSWWSNFIRWCQECTARCGKTVKVAGEPDADGRRSCKNTCQWRTCKMTRNRRRSLRKE
jgi:hypothetical protein